MLSTRLIRNSFAAVLIKIQFLKNQDGGQDG